MNHADETVDRITVFLVEILKVVQNF